MRLLRVGPAGRERPYVLVGDDQLLEVGNVIDDVDQTCLDGDGLDRVESFITQAPSTAVEPLGGRRIGPPMTRPGKVICIGLNYADHAAESGAEPPAEPIVFFKAPNTIVGPDDPVHIPPGSTKTDWEVELGVVIGRTARYLPDVAAAPDCVAGYVVSNDISERHYQLERGGQWVKGKSCETFNPLGPWLVTPDEIDDPQDLAIWLSVNGQRRQDSTTGEMVFGVHHLVWYLSQFMVLEPGDLINTGTPAGVGLGLQPPKYLAAGDVMELGIAGLGRQRQECISAPRVQASVMTV